MTKREQKLREQIKQLREQIYFLKLEARRNDRGAQHWFNEYYKLQKEGGKFVAGLHKLLGEGCPAIRNAIRRTRATWTYSTKTGYRLKILKEAE